MSMGLDICYNADIHNIVHGSKWNTALYEHNLWLWELVVSRILENLWNAWYNMLSDHYKKMLYLPYCH